MLELLVLAFLQVKLKKNTGTTVLAFLQIKLEKNAKTNNFDVLYVKCISAMQIKTFSYNFSKFYANIIYELLRNLTDLHKLNLSVKKPISYKLYTNLYVSYISIV
jgi:hypothetical protein